MRKVVILLYLVQLLFTGFAQAKPGKDREYWVKTMCFRYGQAPHELFAF